MCLMFAVTNPPSSSVKCLTLSSICIDFSICLCFFFFMLLWQLLVVSNDEGEPRGMRREVSD